MNLNSTNERYVRPEDAASFITVSLMGYFEESCSLQLNGDMANVTAVFIETISVSRGSRAYTMDEKYC